MNAILGHIGASSRQCHLIWDKLCLASMFALDATKEGIARRILCDATWEERATWNFIVMDKNTKIRLAVC